MTPSMLQMKVLGGNQTISYDKCFGTDQYNMGHLFLQPGADKGYQFAKNCSFVSLHFKPFSGNILLGLISFPF